MPSLQAACLQQEVGGGGQGRGSQPHWQDYEGDHACDEWDLQFFKNIQVTYEIPEEQTDKKLHVLDFKCWVSEPTKPCEGKKSTEPASILLYTHYEKPMASHYTIMKTSAMSENGKIQSSANDTIRRMKNVTERVTQHERNNVVNQEAVTKIVKSGLQGYEKIRRKSKKEKDEFTEMRSTVSTPDTRKNLMAPVPGSLQKRKNILNPGTRLQSQHQPCKDQRLHQKSTLAQPNCSTNSVTQTVLFIPHTVNGILANCFERGEEHERDYINEKEESQMHCQSVDHEIDLEKPTFSMEIVRCHKTPLYHQLYEAILISMNKWAKRS